MVIFLSCVLIMRDARSVKVRVLHEALCNRFVHRSGVRTDTVRVVLVYS